MYGHIFIMSCGKKMEINYHLFGLLAITGGDSRNIFLVLNSCHTKTKPLVNEADFGRLVFKRTIFCKVKCATKSQPEVNKLILSKI